MCNNLLLYTCVIALAPRLLSALPHCDTSDLQQILQSLHTMLRPVLRDTAQHTHSQGATSKNATESVPVFSGYLTMK